MCSFDAPHLPRRPSRAQSCAGGWNRTRLTAPTAPYLGHSGDQPRHEPGGGSSLIGSSLAEHDLGLCAHRHNRSAADEYFKVSEKVEGLYDQPKHMPAQDERSAMTKLRREMNHACSQRLLRPTSGLTCYFESICESCTYFVTTPEFAPILQRQRDDAAQKGQVGRQRVFDGLLARLQQEAS